MSFDAWLLSLVCEANNFPSQDENDQLLEPVPRLRARYSIAEPSRVDQGGSGGVEEKLASVKDHS